MENSVEVPLKTKNRASIWSRNSTPGLIAREKHGSKEYQFSSVTQSCPTLCDPMDCSIPGLPVHHQLPEFTQTHVLSLGKLSWWCHPTTSSSVVPFSSCSQSFPESGSFHMSQLFESGGQSIGVSTSTSVPPMNMQDWSPLGVFSNTTVQKHQFFSAQVSL